MTMALATIKPEMKSWGARREANQEFKWVHGEFRVAKEHVDSGKYDMEHSLEAKSSFYSTAFFGGCFRLFRLFHSRDVHVFANILQ